VIDVRFLIPGDLATPTGGYAYARRLLADLAAHGVDATAVPLPGSFPHPTPGDLAATQIAIAGTRQDAVLLVDGLAYGALPPKVVACAGSRPIVALVHHPLGLEAGLGADDALRLVASERTALALATRVVVTSRFTRSLLVAEFGVPAGRISVAEPGTDPAPRATGGGSRRVSLLAVGAVTPRKGFDLLVQALATLTDLDWHLTIAGACDRSPDHVAALRRTIASDGLGGWITLAGAVSPDRLAELYDRADIMVSASLFEGYGMALAEALAHGLPVVATTGGAAAETVPDGACLKVAPGDATALAAALRLMVGDPEHRRATADAAWAAGQALPRWRDTAAIVAATLKDAQA